MLSEWRARSQGSSDLGAGSSALDRETGDGPR